VILGVAYSILMAMQKGASLIEAAIMSLLVSGGAVAIYEILKPLISKPSEA
jgi:predicted branched-subunit amino acid permease